MKLQKEKTQGSPDGTGRKEKGFVATVQFIAFLAIMILLAIANARALFQLHREVRFVEQQQIKRLDALGTHSVPLADFNITNANSK